METSDDLTSFHCLGIQEMVAEIASNLDDAEDLYSACLTSRLWYSALLPLRMRRIHVHLESIPSLVSFFKTDPSAIYHCETLRILSDDDGSAPIIYEDELKELLDLLANAGRLKYFTYALYGESRVILPESAWTSLRKLSNGLEGLHADVHPIHWPDFLSSSFPNLRYIRLFLDADAPPPYDYDAKQHLLTFLQQFKQLELLHLCLGSSFDDMDFSDLYFPNLQSFMLISKALGTQLQYFIKKHKTLTSIDVFSDSEAEVPFHEDDLPYLTSLQVCAVTVKWYEWLLRRQPTKSVPAIRNIQVTAADEAGFAYIQRFLTPLGPHLRCLELIFWYRNAEPLSSVINNIAITFPFLVELSVFLPAPELDENEELVGLGIDDLENVLSCFTNSKHFRALTLEDTLSVPLLGSEIENLSSLMPSDLQYIIWRGKTFLIERSGDTLRAIKSTHPRYQRDLNFLTDWHEEMAFEHTIADYS